MLRDAKVSLLKLGLWGVALWLAACAPEVEKRRFAPARQEFDTRQSDTDLALDREISAKALSHASMLAWAADDVPSAELLRASERLLRLGRRLNKPGLENTGERLAQLYYRSSKTTTLVQFEDSLYAQAAVGETEADSAKFIDETRQMLIDDRNIINQTLAASATGFQWPKGRLTANELISLVEKYLNWWMRRLEAFGVDARIVNAIRTAVKTELDTQIPLIRTYFGNVSRATTMTQAVNEMKALVRAMNIELGPESQAELERGAQIGASLDAMRTPQDGLSLLVDFWMMLEPADREAQFGAVSKELYEFLKDLSDKDLKCLKRSGCANISRFLLVLKKHLGVLPTLEEFGVEKLKLQMDQAARDVLIAELETQAAAYMPELPNIVREAVDKEFDSVLAWLARVRRDVPGFIRRMTAKWAEDQLKRDGRELVGIEAATTNVRWSPKGLEIAGRSRDFETGAEVLGSSLALAAERLARLDQPDQAKMPVNLRLVIAQINKMLAIGGFKGPDRKMYRAYAVALNPHAPEGSTVNLRSFLNAPYTYAVLDRFKINGSFSAVLPPLKERSVSVKGQAELLRGFAGMMRYLRDWETSGFDHALGKVSVGPYLDGPVTEGVEDKLFPKDLLFAVALGNASVLLQNMAKDLSPVFLMNLEGESAWSNEFDRSIGNPSTMAGMVDIVGGRRQSVARTEDVARFGLALLDFIDAAEGIRNTTSAPLIEGTEPNRPVDELIKQLPELKNLVIGISNFLARKMQNVDGGLYSTFERGRGEIKGSRRLIDQALAIQLLARAARTLDVKTYGTAALEAYFFMNRSLWKPDLRFYVREEGSASAPTPDEALTVLEAVEDLVPFMGDFSRTQWQSISRPWIGALERF